MKFSKIDPGNISGERLILPMENNLEKITEISGESDRFMIEVIDRARLVITR